MGRKDNKYGYSSFTEEEIRKYIKLLAIPLIVIILVIIIIVAERRANGSGEGESQSVEETEMTVETSAEEVIPETENAAENEDAEAGQMGELAFAKDEVPEVNALLESYFAAKQAADVETVYRLFGRTDTDGMEELQSEYSYTSRYTDGYENIVCYTQAGPAEGSYLVYVSYDLKFKNVETLAPGLFRVYVVTGEDGSLQLVDTSALAPEIIQLFDEAEKTDELILLRTQVYAKLRQALETDPDLAGVYGVLQKNSQFAEEETTGDSDVSIVGGASGEVEIVVETESAAETESAGETESAAGTENTEETEGSGEGESTGETESAAETENTGETENAGETESAGETEGAPEDAE